MSNDRGDDRFIRLQLGKISWFKIRADRDVPPAGDINKISSKGTNRQIVRLTRDHRGRHAREVATR
ncbi:hypothetical protein [Haloquadratum walsbyi]|uniref:hypothetical protein n=1 Tax=Haloquadratum walsbyi TaxID=293091 RepID=UPI0011EA64B9|nr:hypothetical protein [Haloquadratum walsbyi]